MPLARRPYPKHRPLTAIPSGMPLGAMSAEELALIRQKKRERPAQTCRSVETITPSVFTATVHRQNAAPLRRGIRTAKETRNKNGIHLHVIAKISTS